MIWQLTKRDPAWRMTLICLPLAVIAGLALPPSLTGMFSWMVAMTWLQCQPREHATLFQAGLPIRARDLFLARMLAYFSLAWLPLGTAAALFLLTGRPAKDAVTLMEVGAGFSMVVLVAQSSRVRESAGSQWAPLIGWLVVCGAAVPAVLYVPAAWILAASVLVCAALFWNIWRQLPAAFEVAGAAQAAPRSGVHAGAAPAFVWRPVLRSLFAWGIFGLVPLIVLSLAQGQWVLVSVFCVFPVMAVLPRMAWALGLPVRRGALLSLALLPSAAALAGGVVGGFWIRQAPAIRVERSHGRISEVRPPLEYWQRGSAPVITSPWGETSRPAAERVLGVALFNPYSFGAGNSVRFLDWQFRRATEAVYGVPMNYAEFQRSAARPVTRQARFTILSFAACGCWVMLLTNLAFTGMHWRVRRLTQHGQFVVSVLLMLQVGLIILVDMVVDRPTPPSIGVSLANVLLLRASAMLPAGLPAALLAGAVPFALLSWMATRIFRGVEMPPPVATRF